MTNAGVEWGHVIVDADRASFAVIPCAAAHCYQTYARDQWRVYWRGQPVAGADPASFVLRPGSLYARDRAAVYAEGTLISMRPMQFRLLEEGYATDGLSLFWGTNRIAGAGAALLRQGYARDANGVYYHGKRIEGRDPASFVLLDHAYSKDARGVYALGRVIDGADPASFRLLSNGYARDRNAVYFGWIKLGGVDVNTFRLPKACAAMPYAIDHYSVYYAGERLASRDVRSFECMGGNYSKDRQGIYRDDKYLASADAASFYVVRAFGFDKDYGYGKAGQHIERFCKRRDDVPADLSCCHIESSCRLKPSITKDWRR